MLTEEEQADYRLTKKRYGKHKAFDLLLYRHIVTASPRVGVAADLGVSYVTLFKFVNLMEKNHKRNMASEYFQHTGIPWNYRRCAQSGPHGELGRIMNSGKPRYLNGSNFKVWLSRAGLFQERKDELLRLMLESEFPQSLRDLAKSINLSPPTVGVYIKHFKLIEKFERTTKLSYENRILYYIQKKKGPTIWDNVKKTLVG